MCSGAWTTDYRLPRLPTSDSRLPTLVVRQSKSRSAKLDRALRDLLLQQAFGRGVFVAGHREPPCKIAQPRDNNQRGAVLALSPRDAADLAVRDERRIGPDAVGVEPARDLSTERQQIRVIGEHH